MAGAGVEKAELGRSLLLALGRGKEGRGRRAPTSHDGGDGENGDGMARAGEG
jgi:hypothetical protein